MFRSTFIVVAKREQWLKMIICIVCKIFEKIDDRRFFRNWNRCDQFINHIEFMKNFATRYEFQNVTLLNANEWTTIYFHECKFYRKATNMHKQTWNQKKIVLNEKHSNTLINIINLISTYRNQKRWKKVEKFEMNVMKIKKKKC